MVLTRLIVTVLLVAAVLTACGKVDHRAAQQTLDEGWTEPVGAGIGAVDMLVRYPKNLQAIVDYADLIVSGDIVSINDTSTTFKMQEGTPEREVSEKIGSGSTFDVIGKDIVIAVSDTLKGTTESNEVLSFGSFLCRLSGHRQSQGRGSPPVLGTKDFSELQFKPYAYAKKKIMKHAKA